jgi:hypothetical protein
MKTLLARIITALTFNQVRFQISSQGRVSSLRWFWTPITARFAHGGWVYLSPRWLWRFRAGTRYA